MGMKVFNSKGRPRQPVEDRLAVWGSHARLLKHSAPSLRASAAFPPHEPPWPSLAPAPKPAATPGPAAAQRPPTHMRLSMKCRPHGPVPPCRTWSVGMLVPVPPASLLRSSSYCVARRRWKPLAFICSSRMASSCAARLASFSRFSRSRRSRTSFMRSWSSSRACGCTRGCGRGRARCPGKIAWHASLRCVRRASFHGRFLSCPAVPHPSFLPRLRDMAHGGVLPMKPAKLLIVHPVTLPLLGHRPLPAARTHLQLMPRHR